MLRLLYGIDTNVVVRYFYRLVGSIMRGRMQMASGRIVIITGAPGSGKTTVSEIVAEKSEREKSVHMRTDDFYGHLSKGAIPPWLPGSEEQNEIVIEAFAEAAKRYARGGYDVIVDGVIGPWVLSMWHKIAMEGYEIQYIVLRADREETLRRAVGRDKLDRATNTELVNTMWKQFCDLGMYERYVIDSTELTVRETVEAVKERISNGAALLR